MYENKTYENILQDALSQVDNSIDKRQGAIIYDSLAPFSAELAKFYIDLIVNQNLYLPDTATGEWLTRVSAMFGVNRKSATTSVKLGLFYENLNQLFDVPIGSRFSGGDINYVVIKRNSLGNFDLEAETAGSIGNDYIGNLIPITFINGLSRGEMTSVVISGSDQESDEQLRIRLSDTVNRPAFGGNVSDYRQTVKSMNGVGECKVTPTWNGGGTVRVAIIASDFNPPTTALVQQIQEAVDPSPQGNGIGLAPIGHTVTVVGVVSLPVNVVATFTLSNGIDPQTIKPELEQQLREYLYFLRSSEWANNSSIVVRISQIESRFLNVAGVLDVNNTSINGTQSNLTVSGDNVPMFGSVTMNV